MMHQNTRQFWNDIFTANQM